MIRILGVVGILFFSGCGVVLHKPAIFDKDDEKEESVYFENAVALSLGLSVTEGWEKLPIEFRLDSAFTESQRQQVESAFEIWNTAIGEDVLLVHRDPAPPLALEAGLFQRMDDRIDAIYLESDWCSTGKSLRVLGTAIWKNVDGNPNQIESADIFLNNHVYFLDDAFAFETWNHKREIVDLTTLLLHEIGHAIGLAHISSSDEPNSIMKPEVYVGAGLSNRQLSAFDILRARFVLGYSSNLAEDLKREADSQPEEQPIEDPPLEAPPAKPLPFDFKCDDFTLRQHHR